MEDLLAHERAVEQYVYGLLKSTDTPPEAVIAALNNYRLTSKAAIFADFHNVEQRESRLWKAHTDARKFFHKILKVHRSQPKKPVERRKFEKQFLAFLKQSHLFFRTYMASLSTACGGISGLETFTHLGGAGSIDESLQLTLPFELHDAARASCHRCLIYVGDLCRYRASEKLDEKPDYAHAVGYYDLAATFEPASGLGHHQLAVIALEQRNHLNAIYHLYRSMCVLSPHPNAAQNLEIEFGKTNAAWDKGELIYKGSPNDPEGPKHALIGWFVRLQSMCYKGQPFRGHEELEREFLSQLATVVKQRPLGRSLMRIMLVNIAAQHTAGERFQVNPNEQFQQSFLFFFRLNLKTFATFLRVFYDDLHALLLEVGNHDAELNVKLTPVNRRLLPCLRVYTNWLMPILHMIQGLAFDESLKDAVQEFWIAYARAIDLTAQAFPIWDLEDVSDVLYMLEEDVQTLGFQPVTDPKTSKTWYLKQTDSFRPRFSDQNVVRVSPDEEMLQRVKDFLGDGVALANDGTTPIKLQGTRIFVGHEQQIEPLIVKPQEYHLSVASPNSIAALEKPKPVSYAAAAANGHAGQSRAPTMSRMASSKAHSRDAQLSRMVDDLVDDDDGNNPITPPQQPASIPIVVANGENGDALQDSVHDLIVAAPKQFLSFDGASAKPIVGHPIPTVTPPAFRHIGNTPRPWIGQHDRLHEVSKLWNGSQSSVPSSAFPSGLTTGTLGSPGAVTARGHSRVNSANSVRSRGSLAALESWRPIDNTPHVGDETFVPETVYGSYTSHDQAGMASPLLFGAGGGPWSANALRHTSPANGQGG